MAAFFSIHVASTRHREIEEDDARRIADGSVMAGEVQATGRSIHAEDGDIVIALITAIEELSARVKVETARIISACPFFSEKCQDSV